MSSIVQIKDSAYDGLQSLRVYGNTRQNLWVTPEGTKNGVTITSNDDGSVIVSGTATIGAYAALRAYVLRPGTQYTLSIDKMVDGAKGFYIDAYDDSGTSIQVIYIGGTQGAYLSKTFTLANRAVRVLYGFGVNAGGTVSGTYRVMLNEGSEAQPWCPPGLNSVEELAIVASTTDSADDGTTTPIDLDGNTLCSLPDGTHDELTIDATGAVTLTKRVGVATAPTAAGSWRWESDSKRGVFSLPSAGPRSQPDETSWLLCDKLPVRDGTSVGETSYAIVSDANAYAKNPAITSTATAATVAGGATYIYKLAEPQTIDLGTIDLPKLRKKPLLNTILANSTASGTGFSLAPEIDCAYNRWSTYCDGFKTHGKHSYFDMGCCLAARDTGTPEKKNLTATVPYMSGYYDFSKLYGAIAFEARQLTYRFEFVEDSREELQQKKSQFLEWLSQVHDEEIADDDIPGRHFIGSLSEWEFEEGEEGQSGSLEVTFNCQPFLEADEDTTKTCNAGSNTVTVKGQPVNAYAKTSSGTATIQIGGVTQSVGTTEIRLSVQLQPGDNAVTVTGSPVVLRWKELTA